ncbi:sensor histidine kinase [Hymenobacter daeguensis]
MDAPAEVAFGQLLLGGIGFMLLSGGTLLMFLVTYQKRLLRQQLHQRTTEAAFQQQQLTAVIEAQERERERIGRDLHDGIGSTIAMAKMLVNRLDTNGNQAESAALLTLVKEIMSTAVQDVRSVSHSLYPAVLARFGLADALQHLVDVCNETAALAIELTVLYPRPLALAQELALYRICQELIHNALKHARGATLLTVHLHQAAALLTLVVEDNGCGFAPASPDGPPLEGIGLRSIQVRVQMLQAQLRHEPLPGQGTRMVIELPVPIRT